MLYAIVTVLILITDQWIKYWVSSNIVLSTGSETLIPNVLDLVNIHNSGAAFSMFEGGDARWIFVGLAAVVVIALIVLLSRGVLSTRFTRWCAVLAIAGAIGNCIDRIMLGYVVDMFKVTFMNFAVFNFADIVLVVACALFIIYMIVDIFKGGVKDEPKAAKPAAEPKAKKKPAAKTETQPETKVVAKAAAKPEAKKKPAAKPKAEPKPEPKVKKPAEDFFEDSLLDLSSLSSEDFDIEEKSAPIKAEPAPVKAEPAPVKAEPAPEKAAAEEEKAPLDDDPFWNSFKEDSVRIALEAEEKRRAAAAAADEYDLESILNEFR